MLATKVHLALIPNAHQKLKKKKKKERKRGKQGKKDLRNQNAEEGKMYCVYMMKCSLFSCGLSFFFSFVDFFCCSCCSCCLLIFWLRSNAPFLNRPTPPPPPPPPCHHPDSPQPPPPPFSLTAPLPPPPHHPSAILLMNWHTPKHLGLLFMHWPPSSHFITSVPMLAPFTLCTIS